MIAWEEPGVSADELRALRRAVAEAVSWPAGKVSLWIDEVRYKPRIGHLLWRYRGDALVDNVLLGTTPARPVDQRYDRHRAMQRAVQRIERELELSRLERGADR